MEPRGGLDGEVGRWNQAKTRPSSHLARTIQTRACTQCCQVRFGGLPASDEQGTAAAPSPEVGECLLIDSFHPQLASTVTEGHY